MPQLSSGNLEHWTVVKPFDALVAEAEAADVSGWGFDWLAGRASEERPPWGYARLLA